MADSTKISWCDATWNPFRGCTPISESCRNCYAAAFAKLRPNLFPGGFGELVRSKTTFNDPLKWKDPRRVFVCSLSDFFHPDADEWRHEAWDVIQQTPRHTYLILTKRPERTITPWVNSPWPNVWLGVTAENQERIDERIPRLIDVPAAKRFVSIEPMLSEIDLSPWLGSVHKLDLIIVGAESGPNRREMKLGWLESVVDQCRAANVPVFVKQGSHRFPGRQGDIPDHLWRIKEIPDGA